MYAPTEQKISEPHGSDSLLPSWAKELLRRPLVEIRRGISLGYKSPFEDSSVLVLTAPSGKFVDIRFSNQPRSQISRATKNPDKIWGYATAGLSSATIQQGEGECPPYDCMVHVKWEHAIDSTGSFDTDGADMFLLSNGDRMEVGFMEIHEKMQMFKEYWICPTGNEVELLPCTVVELRGSQPDQQDTAAKGMAIRIGNYCQGILQDGDNFWFERWEFRQGQQEWAKDVRSNTPESELRILPCFWMVESSRIAGNYIKLDGKDWEVFEALNEAQA